MTIVTRTHRVLVAYDGTAPSRRALARTAELVRPGDAVRIISVLPYPGVDAAAEQRADQVRLLEHARRAPFLDGVDVETVATEGDPATEILAAARVSEADVIVFALDRERFPHTPGSMTDAIVRDAPCDVYVVYAHPDRAGTP